jgi:hypothetical protein
MLKFVLGSKPASSSAEGESGKVGFFLVKRVLGQGPELREPNKAVLCPLIIKI